MPLLILFYFPSQSSAQSFTCTRMDGQNSGNDKEARQPSVAHSETHKPHGIYDVEARDRNKLSAIFENPLAGVPRDQLFDDVDRFCQQYNLEEYKELFRKGALVSQNPTAIETLPELKEDEREALRRETTHKWSQPWMLYFMTGESILAHSRRRSLIRLSAMCSMAAAVQGMDETANNGAVVIYPKVGLCNRIVILARTLG